MHKRFRCGLLMLANDGKVKKLGLENGGGSRLCDWSDKSMTLKDVHHLIRNLFKLADIERETSLYDFKLQPLNFNQYRTFFEYIDQQGLNCTSTVIYVCTHEGSNNNSARKSSLVNEKKVKQKTLNSSISREETSVETITSASITSMQFNRVDVEQNFNQQQIANSSYEYSLLIAISSIMKNLREMISKNRFYTVLMKLFENMSIIDGYSCLLINSLKQRIALSKTDFQLISQSEIILYSNCLNNFLTISESTVKLFKGQKNRFSNIELYSTIRESFIVFYHNLKILHTNWIKRVEKYDEANRVSSSFVRLEPPTSSNSNTQSLSQCNIGKAVETSSKDHRETANLFQQLLKCARDLLNTMNNPNLSTFRDMIQSIIVDIESLQSTINICDPKSLGNAKQTVNSIKFQYTNKFDADALTSPKYHITRPTKQACEKTLTAMCDLLSYLTNYQIQTVADPRKSSNLSSAYVLIDSQEKVENRLSIQSHKRKLEIVHADNHGHIEIKSIKRESLPHHIKIENKRKK
ncbi:unnamed protein product [Rotaria socialis]|uniref:Uncharacterized protein n=2 Tax=Rotaria socialis TaxID=392032 RepID=A0A820QNC2_9BILA|nr:unnamed protein product [Rotaria socialis]CAF4512119.1 unnamed protein product [Rotaria socialis]